MAFTDPGIMTPYSSVIPLVGNDLPLWVDEEEQERIASYTKYEEIYWNHAGAFKLVQRGADDKPIYIPEPRTIVDATAHYMLKDLSIELDGYDPDSPQALLLKGFLDREMFFTKFHTNKHAGVVRGDWLFHIKADATKAEGTRVSIYTVDPGAYFPIYDEDDPEKRIGVDLVEQLLCADNVVRLKIQRYRIEVVAGRRRVSSELVIYELDRWWDEKERKLWKTLTPKKLLPERITQIPVYAFKNIDWEGQLYGSSELRGYERLFAAINQTITDEEVALALQGLGVYATDAGPPEIVDEEGGVTDGKWEIAPASVMELPAGAYFKRVEGLSSVEPSQDHIKYLTEALYRTTAHFDTTQIDVAIAESGIARAIRFLPTLAKIEQRDEQSLGVLRQMGFDLRTWLLEYENIGIDRDFVFRLGDKLPRDRDNELNELNNWLDRKVISRKFYREQLKVRFGIVIPEDMEDEVLQEEESMAEARVFKEDNTEGPNNKDRPNESSGTEATNGTKSARQRREGKKSSS